MRSDLRMDGGSPILEARSPSCPHGLGGGRVTLCDCALLELASRGCSELHLQRSCGKAPYLPKTGNMWSLLRSCGKAPYLPKTENMWSLLRMVTSCAQRLNNDRWRGQPPTKAVLSPPLPSWRCAGLKIMEL